MEYFDVLNIHKHLNIVTFVFLKSVCLYLWKRLLDGSLKFVTRFGFSTEAMRGPEISTVDGVSDWFVDQTPYPIGTNC